MSIRSIGLGLAGLALSVMAAAAQDSPTRVVPPGTLRIEAGGIFSSFGETFGSLGSGSGERNPFSTPFRASLDRDVFQPLDILERRLERLMPDPGEAEEQLEVTSLGLRAASLHLGADRREVPFLLEIGVLPRLSLQIRVPLVQNWVQVNGLTVDGGNVGINPDGGFNRELVAGTDTTLIALAGGRFLPVSGTQAAQRLQDTVRAATGGRELRLPTDAAGEIGILGLDEVPGFERQLHEPGIPAWGLGDVLISARVALVNTIGRTLGPEAGSGLRLAAEGGLRLATGEPVTADYLGLPPPADGLSGFFLAAAGDAFLNPRFGVSAHGRFERLDAVDVGRRTWVEGEEFPPTPVDQTVRWEPGQRVTVSVLPRFQVANEISLFGRFSLASQSGESFGPALVTPSTRTGQLWGVGAEFSTLRTNEPQVGRLPFEVILQISSHAAGTGGQPATRSVAAAIRFYPRLWGRGGESSAGDDAVEQ